MSRIRQGRHEAGSEALARYLAVSDPGDPERGIALVRRGLALGEAGRPDAARAALDSASSSLPWFGDWLDLFAAEVSAEVGDTAEVRRRLAASDPELVRERGWRLRLDAAREAGDSQAARQAALDAARTATDGARRAVAWAVLGTLRLEDGDTARAREAWRSGMEAAPGTTGAVDAARGLSELGPTPEEWRTIAGIYLRHGNPTRAAEGLERYLEAGIGTPAERAQARLQLGSARFDAGRYRDAERALLTIAMALTPSTYTSATLAMVSNVRLSDSNSMTCSDSRDERHFWMRLTLKIFWVAFTRASKMLNGSVRIGASPSVPRN